MCYHTFNPLILFQYLLLLMCVFGDTSKDVVEATLQIRLESSSTNIKSCDIKTNLYNQFHAALFNLKTESITIHYKFDGTSDKLFAYDITNTTNQASTLSSYYNCYNNQSTTIIVCNRWIGGNKQCANKTVILWTYEGESLDSVHFINTTKDCVSGNRTLVYTLKDSGQSTSNLPKVVESSSNLATTNVNSQPENSQADSSGIIAGVVVSIVLVILITIIVVYIRKRREKESSRIIASNINNNRAGNEYQQKICNKSNVPPNITSNISTFSTHTFQQNVNAIHISHNKGAYSFSESDYTGIDDNLQSSPAPEDDYNYIDDVNSDVDKDESMPVDDGYSNIDLTTNDYNEIDDGVEIRHNEPNYSNIPPQSRKDVYSKLGEKLRSFQNTYGVGVDICEEENVGCDICEEESVEDELKVSDTYFSLESEQQDYNIDETVDNDVGEEQVDNVVDDVEEILE